MSYDVVYIIYEKTTRTKSIVIYQAKNGAIELRGDFERETVWATQAEIAKVFGVTPQKHNHSPKNIYAQKSFLCKQLVKNTYKFKILQ